MEAQTSDEPLASQPGDEIQEWIDQGRQQYRQGDFQEALSYLHQAHAALTEAGSPIRLAEVTNDIGVVYIVLQQWKQAEKWLDEAQTQFIALGDLDGEAQTLGNMGSMYRARGNLRDAAAHLQLAADRFHLVGDDERRSATLRSLGMVRLRQVRLWQALAAFEAAYASLPNPSAVQRFLHKLLVLPLRLVQRT